MIKETKNILEITGADEFYQTLLNNAPEWFVNFRQENKKQACEVAIPTVKDEEWKYTSLALLTDHEYHLPTHHDVVDEDKIWQFINKDEIHFVLINGCFISSLTNCDGVEGLTMTHLQEAIDRGLLKEEDFNRSTTNDVQPFLAVNNAFHRCGAYVHIDRNFKSDRLIHIIHVNTGEENYSVCPRNIIKMDRSTEASVLESYVSLKDSQYFINQLTDIHLDENAILHHAKNQADSLDAIHIAQTRCWQRRDSRLDSFALMTGSTLNRNNISVISQGEGTDSIINGLYVLNGKQHVDNHTLIDHTQPNCTSHQLYKGILNDQTRSVFNGKIYVKKIAQQTNSYQLNKNLLLGKDARVDTKPQLEIFADDVRCTHGATIGQLSDEEVFYLQSRCVNKEDAVRMLAQGFMQDIFDLIQSQKIKEKLEYSVEV